MNPEKGELSSIYSSIYFAQYISLNIFSSINLVWKTSLFWRLKSLDNFSGQKDVSLLAFRMLLHLKTFVSILSFWRARGSVLSEACVTRVVQKYQSFVLKFLPRMYNMNIMKNMIIHELGRELNIWLCTQQARRKWSKIKLFSTFDFRAKNFSTLFVVTMRSALMG